MSPLDLHADCARCDALCCVSLAFDRSSSFAIDKKAGDPCHHLVGPNCSLHRILVEEGFSGCGSYDCQGAGQRITQYVYRDFSWHTHPERRPRIFNAFHLMRRIHDLLVLLFEVRKQTLSNDNMQFVDEFIAQLCPQPDWKPRTLEAFDIVSAHQDVHRFLRGLAPQTQQRKALTVIADNDEV